MIKFDEIYELFVSWRLMKTLIGDLMTLEMYSKLLGKWTKILSFGNLRIEVKFSRFSNCDRMFLNVNVSND